MTEEDARQRLRSSFTSAVKIVMRDKFMYTAGVGAERFRLSICQEVKQLMDDEPDRDRRLGLIREFGMAPCEIDSVIAMLHKRIEAASSMTKETYSEKHKFFSEKRKKEDYKELGAKWCFQRMHGQHDKRA